MKAFEAMQVEMDAINKHLESLTNENQQLTAKLDSLTNENAAARDRNVELLTRYDILSKEFEKNASELNKISKEGKTDPRKTKDSDKHEKEKTSLQTKIDKLDLENKLLKNSLANASDEQKRLAESLRSLLESKKALRKNSGTSWKDVVWEESETNAEISGPATTKPDLIRDSTAMKDEYMIVEQRKYRSDLSVIESSGTDTDIKELVADLLNGQMSLKGYCLEISKIVKDECSDNSKSETDGEDLVDAKVDLDITKADWERKTEDNDVLESNLQSTEMELAKIREEKVKLESDSAIIKEKCEKLEAVFRALILLMNNKKNGEKKTSEEAGGPTRIIDYFKGMKTKYVEL